MRVRISLARLSYFFIAVSLVLFASAGVLAWSKDSGAWFAFAKDGVSDIRTFVTLHVNATDQGETIAIVRGDDVLVPIAVLEQAGAHGLKGSRETIKGQEYVSLASLAPDVAFKLNIDALALEVDVAPGHMPSTTVNMENNRPANIVYTTSKSAYVNYAVTAASGGLTSAFFDGSFNHAQDSLHYSFTEQQDNGFRRGLVYYQMDNRSDSTRTVVGDVAANSGDLGGSLYMGGVGTSRDFDLDPYAIRFPLPSLAGVVTSPSIANVYVNGVLVQRVELPPGQFNLNQLPVTTGSANTQIIVTDAFGRSQSYSQNYYTAANLLTPGLTDYQYSAGFLRPNAFQDDDSYGPAAVVGRYRVGVNDSLTAGGRFEATPHMVSLGPTVDFKLPIGYVHIAAAASDLDGFGGAAASLGWTFNTPRYGFGIAYLAQGPYYATISQPLSFDRPTSAINAFGSVQVGHGSTISLQYFRRKMRDSGTANQLALSETAVLPHGLSLTVTAEHDTSTTAAPLMGVTTTLNFAVGRTTASVTSQAGTTKDNNVQIQQSPPGRYGLSYYASYDPSFEHTLNASMLYRSLYGDVQADYGVASNTTPTEALRIAGGVAFIDNGVFPTRPVTGSYALVDVPNTPGVEVYFQNEAMGKTNRSGKLLVPDLLPNYGNTIRIDDKDLPLSTSVQGTSQMIAPPAQAGAVVKFEAEQIHALNGNIVVNLDGKTIVPEYGELTLDGANAFHAESVLGKSGEFYLENIPGGKYAAHVVFREGSCDFEFTAPQAQTLLVKLGTLGCVAK